MSHTRKNIYGTFQFPTQEKIAAFIDKTRGLIDKDYQEEYDNHISSLKWASPENFPFHAKRLMDFLKGIMIRGTPPSRKCIDALYDLLSFKPRPTADA